MFRSAMMISNKHAAVVGGFDPLTLNPYLWHDFTDITTMYQDTAMTLNAVLGGPIGAISDKSASGITLSAAANKPVLTAAMLNGLSGAALTTITSSIGKQNVPLGPVAYDYFCILQVVSAASYAYMIDFGGGGNLRAITAGAQHKVWYDQVFKSSYDYTKFVILNYTRNGASSSASVNGVTNATGNVTSTNTISRVYYGGDPWGSGAVINLCESIVLPLLSAPDRLAMNTHLSGKFGIPLGSFVL